MKGELYHNFYCFTFRVEGEKVAEVWEHADTLYVYRKCLQ
jgi:ketosteroid isomerase-like protein